MKSGILKPSPICSRKYELVLVKISTLLEFPHVRPALLIHVSPFLLGLGHSAEDEMIPKQIPPKPFCHKNVEVMTQYSSKMVLRSTFRQKTAKSYNLGYK